MTTSAYVVSVELSSDHRSSPLCQQQQLAHYFVVGWCLEWRRVFEIWTLDVRHKFICFCLQSPTLAMLHNVTSENVMIGTSVVHPMLFFPALLWREGARLIQFGILRETESMAVPSENWSRSGGIKNDTSLIICL